MRGTRGDRNLLALGAVSSAARIEEKWHPELLGFARRRIGAVTWIVFRRSTDRSPQSQAAERAGTAGQTTGRRGGSPQDSGQAAAMPGQPPMPDGVDTAMKSMQAVRSPLHSATQSLRRSRAPASCDVETTPCCAVSELAQAAVHMLGVRPCRSHRACKGRTTPQFSPLRPASGAAILRYARGAAIAPARVSR